MIYYVFKLTIPASGAKNVPQIINKMNSPVEKHAREYTCIFSCDMQEKNQKSREYYIATICHSAIIISYQQNISLSHGCLLFDLSPDVA